MTIGIFIEFMQKLQISFASQLGVFLLLFFAATPCMRGGILKEVVPLGTNMYFVIYAVY